MGTGRAGSVFPSGLLEHLGGRLRDVKVGAICLNRLYLINRFHDKVCVGSFYELPIADDDWSGFINTGDVGRHASALIRDVYGALRLEAVGVHIGHVMGAYLETLCRGAKPRSGDGEYGSDTHRKRITG